MNTVPKGNNGEDEHGKCNFFVIKINRSKITIEPNTEHGQDKEYKYSKFIFLGRTNFLQNKQQPEFHSHTAYEGLLRIQYKCQVPIYVFPEMKLCSLLISITEL
jgi:hypothetical protein